VAGDTWLGRRVQVPVSEFGQLGDGTFSGTVIGRSAQHVQVEFDDDGQVYWYTSRRLMRWMPQLASPAPDVALADARPDQVIEADPASPLPRRTKAAVAALAAGAAVSDEEEPEVFVVAEFDEDDDSGTAHLPKRMRSDHVSALSFQVDAWETTGDEVPVAAMDDAPHEVRVVAELDDSDEDVLGGRMKEAQQRAAAIPAAAEARRQAEAEGLTLITSSRSAAGFKGVAQRTASRTFQAQRYDSCAQKQVHLGNFATAEEAALTVARAGKAAGGDGARRAEAEQHRGPALTPAEARREAEAEGLTLITSSKSNSGFKGVFLKPSGDAAGLTPAEARRQAETAGLTLVVSDSGTGFKGVKRKPSGFFSGRPAFDAFHFDSIAQMEKYLGSFATAEEAALAVARVDKQAEQHRAGAARNNSTGFKSVVARSKPGGTFQAKRHDSRAQKHVRLNSFATAEEAALAVVRADTAAEAVAVAATAAEAEARRREKEVEGLTLVPPPSPAQMAQAAAQRAQQLMICASQLATAGQPLADTALAQAEAAMARAEALARSLPPPRAVQGWARAVESTVATAGSTLRVEAREWREAQPPMGRQPGAPDTALQAAVAAAARREAEEQARRRMAEPLAARVGQRDQVGSSPSEGNNNGPACVQESEGEGEWEDLVF
jgi:hypothetical protein